MSTVLLVVLAGYFIVSIDAAEISIPSPLPLRIDKNLRKALLKALEKLDDDDSRSERDSRDSDKEEILDTSTDKNDDDDEEIPNFEKLPINVKEIDEDDFENKFIDSVKADISKKEDDVPTKITVRNEITDKDSKVTVEAGKLYTSKSLEASTQKSSARTARILNNNKGENSLSTPTGFVQGLSSTQVAQKFTIQNFVTTQRFASTTEKTTPSSPNPTHSTPTEAADEAQLKVDEVQFIHAPLVAAFTVQQDAKGLPQKVIPIFGGKIQDKNIQPIKQQNFLTEVQSLEQKQRALEQHILYLQQKRKQEELLLQQTKQGELIQQQRKQEELLQRQRKQEELLQQQRKQEELLQQQRKKEQLLLQQQDLKKQESFNIHLQEQQLPLRQNSISFNTDPKNLQDERRTQVVTQQLPLQQQFSFTTGNIVQQDTSPFISQQLPLEHRTIPFNPIPPKTPPKQGSVQIQPSLSFQPQKNIQFSELHFSGQQLPIKEAVAFQPQKEASFQQPLIFNRNNIFTQQQLPLQQQFSFNDNFVQDSLRVQLPPLPAIPIPQFQSLPLQSSQSTRVFRQEPPTGNFGFNRPQSQNVQTFKSISLSRPFVDSRQTVFPNQITIDDRLKTLFYQSGFGQGRTQEDLNIVSKVLALDHTR